MISALSEYYSDANENWDDGIASGAWKQEVIRGDTGPVEETEFRIYWVILFNIYYFFFWYSKTYRYSNDKTCQQFESGW